MFADASRFAPALLALAGSAVVLVAAAPEPIDHDVNARIRVEARDRSQIMQTLHVLTDVYGPRLTGSPNHKAAAEWAVGEMKKWGFDAGGLEEWDFGHPRWLNERLSAHVVSPVKDALVGEALASATRTSAGSPACSPTDAPSNSTSTSSIAGTRRAGPPTTPSPRLPARTRRAR